MNAFNQLITKTAGYLLDPFGSMPLFGLLFWSVVIGLLMTWVFGKTSRQQALVKVADHTRAQLLAVRLFRDDLGVTFGCQVELLKSAGWRLWYSLLPMLVMFIPFLVILVQLDLRYETMALLPNDRVIVELQLDPKAWHGCRNVQLEVPKNVTLETPGLRDETKNTIAWRICAQSSGVDFLRWQLDDEIVKKTLTVAEDSHSLMLVSPRRPGAGWIDRMLHPAEPGFSSTSAVRGVEVEYPRQRMTAILGWDVPWWATFLVVSIIAALAVRPLLGVQF